MQLVFVYNADSGVFNTVSDIAHKLISPSTYQCNLCSLTHGYFSARGEWLDFLQNLGAEIEFLHRDEFVLAYPECKAEYPAVFIKKPDGLALWLDKAKINKMKSVDELMDVIRNALIEKLADNP